MKADKLYLAVIGVLVVQFCSFISYSQVGSKLGTGSTYGTKTATAVLDLGTGNQGLLLPRVNLTSKSSPLPLGTLFSSVPAGMTVYNMASINDVTPGIYYSDGASWNRNEEVSVVNGLTKSTESIRLGGTLNQQTIIAQDVNDIVFRAKDGSGNSVETVRFKASNGFIGIGTVYSNNSGAVPSHKLHIFGGGAGLITPLINLEANAGAEVTAGTGVSIRFSPTNPAGFGQRAAEISAINQGGNAIDLVFRTTYASNSFLERMRISSTDTIQLNVMSAIDKEGSLILGRQDNTSVRYSRISVGNGVGSGNNYLAFDVHDGSNIAPFNSLKRAMFVRGDGNVGVGTTAPTSTLHTNGTIAVTTGSSTSSSVILTSVDVTLPPAENSPGRIYIIRNTNSTASITVGSLVNFAVGTPGAFTLTAAQGAIIVVSNGSNWYRIQ